MAAVNMFEIGSRLKTLFKEGLSGTYDITLNADLESSPAQFGKNDGWIGIYKMGNNYTPLALPGRWQSEVKFMIVILTASLRSNENADRKIGEAEQQVINLLQANIKLTRDKRSVVGTTQAYSVSYSEALDQGMYIQRADIEAVFHVPQ